MIISTIRFVFAFGMISLAAWIIWTVYQGYSNATGTTWQRLLAGARGSATFLWSKFCLVLAGVVTNLNAIADALGQPEAKQYIADAIGNPKIVGALMLGVTLVNIWARLRTLGP